MNSKQSIEEAALEYATKMSNAPDKGTPDWIITDFKAGAQWQLEQFKSAPIRTFEQILESDYHVSLEDNRRDESIKLAAEKYAEQFKAQEQKPVINIREKYKEWCKETKRNGSVLVGGSIYEFFEWLNEQSIQKPISSP